MRLRLASSSYYKSEMRHIHAQIMDVKKKKEQYENYGPKLAQLASKLGPIKNSIKDSEKFFKKGGFTSGGQTLSQGEVLKKSTKLVQAKEILQEVIQKMQLKIQEWNQKLKTLQAQYDAAEHAYNRALKEESKNKK